MTINGEPVRAREVAGEGMNPMAIPPAYAEYLGRQVMAMLERPA